MKNHNNHTPYNSDMERVLDQFSEEERADTEEIWRLSKKARHSASFCSEGEIEEALRNVHFRIEEIERSTGKSFSIAGSIIKHTRYLVAAVALLALVAGYFLIPKTMSVPYAETAVIELPDGSTVEMNSGTTLRYNRLFSYSNRSVTLNGEAYFSVKSDSDPFIVEANGTAIEVTGTEFNVRSWQDDPKSATTLTVTEGSVLFYPRENPSNSVSLKPGETSRWNSSLSAPGQPESSPPDAALAWRENKLIFQDTPFIVILNDLERSYNVTIELDVSGIEMETLTAYYSRPANVESILEDLCTVKGLRYTKTSNGYRIYK